MSLDSARSEAARVAAHVDLRDVRLWGVQADLLNVPDGDHEDRLSYKFNADLQVQHSEDNGILLVLGSYSLSMRAVPAEQAPDEDAEVDDVQQESEDVTTIGFKLNALFAVEHEPLEPFTESELTAFGQTTGQFALYPYAREFIADLTGRMGLPPLHIGVMRLHLETRDG